MNSYFICYGWPGALISMQRGTQKCLEKNMQSWVYDCYSYNLFQKAYYSLLKVM